jgi:hypothetical protein
MVTEEPTVQKVYGYPATLRPGDAHIAQGYDGAQLLARLLPV